MTPTEESNVENKVDRLIEIAAEVKRSLNIRSAVVGLLMVVLCFIAVNNWINGSNTRKTLSAVESVTGPDGQKRQAAGTVDVLRRNAIETDCRSRRQQARLPAPDSAIPCDQQTDPSVFPGTTGLPARG